MKCRLTGVVAGLVTVGSLLGGCARERDTSVEIRVLVASSLATAFDRLAQDFEEANPGVEVVPTVGGSATLAAQVEQGLGFDVAAFADEETMARLVSGGHVVTGSVRIFATNSLAILVAEGNPLGIESIEDLGRGGIRVSLCDRAQPCGRYAVGMLDRAEMDIDPTSVESSVGAVAGRVGSGEVDAGIAYVTEDRVPGVDIVAIPADLNVVARYPIGLSNEVLSFAEPYEDFVSYVLSARGQQVLREEGFGAP